MPEYCKTCYGVPALLEQSQPEWIELSEHALLDTLALWKKPLYARFRGYYFTLFNLVASEAQIYSTDKLPSSKLTVVDGASMLGFDVSFSSKGRKDSKGEEKGIKEPETIVSTQISSR